MIVFLHNETHLFGQCAHFSAAVIGRNSFFSVLTVQAARRVKSALICQEVGHQADLGQHFTLAAMPLSWKGGRNIYTGAAHEIYNSVTSRLQVFHLIMAPCPCDCSFIWQKQRPSHLRAEEGIIIKRGTPVCVYAESFIENDFLLPPTKWRQFKRQSFVIGTLPWRRQGSLKSRDRSEIYLVVECPHWDRKVTSSNPGRVKPKTLKLRPNASMLDTKYEGVGLGV